MKVKRWVVGSDGYARQRTFEALLAKWRTNSLFETKAEAYALAAKDYERSIEWRKEDIVREARRLHQSEAALRELERKRDVAKRLAGLV